MSLREQKKQKTRKSISDLATQLFIEHGYHNVTTAEIAELAEVSIPTLFNYFPSKESFVFDEDLEMEKKLVNAVINRESGMSILDALLNLGLSEIEIHKHHLKDAKIFMKLVDQTPELNLYAKQMWTRHEKSLATVIRKELKNKVSKLEAESFARFVLDSYHRALGTSSPRNSLKALFQILKNGWKE